VVGGSPVNFVSSNVFGATIGGGGAANYFGTADTNSVTANFGTVGGGAGNAAAGVEATVGGGGGNNAGGPGSTVAGGSGNYAGGQSAATVGGGSANSADGIHGSTVAGGQNNTVSGGYDGAIGGGFSNSVSAGYATIPGGYQNVASGGTSFAAGNQAQATNDGAFVWADSQDLTFSSTGNDQFLIRAQGGVGIGTNYPAASLDIASSNGIYGPQLQLDQQADDYVRLRFAPYTNAPWDIDVKTVMNFAVGGGPNGGNVMSLAANGNLSVAGVISGNGGGLTNLNAATLAIPPGMALIPAGAFTMGDSLDGEGDAIPTVSITVSAIYMDVNLVSFAQWQSVYFWAKRQGYLFDDAGAGNAPNQPVQTVNWYDVVKWSNARSQQ
jgi:hypothetical protein